MIKTLILGLGILFTFQAVATTEAEVQAQAILQRVEEGTNAFNEEKVLSSVDADASMISKNGEVVVNLAGVSDYFSRMVKGKAILKKMTSVAQFTHSPIISDQSIVWIGDSDDQYEFSNGLSLKIKTLFTSLMIKTETGWKIKHIHFGFNVWDYPILAAAKFGLTLVPGILFIVAFVLGFLGLWLKQSVSKKRSGLMLIFISLMLLPPLSKADSAEPEFLSMLSTFWSHPSQAETHPLFTVITSAGEVTQGKKNYLALSDLPKLSQLGHVLKTSQSGDSAVIIGTVKQTFEKNQKEAITFEDNFSAVFVRESAQNKWKLAAYQTSSQLFDNPLLKNIRTELLLRGFLATVLGLVLGGFIFQKTLKNPQITNQSKNEARG